MKNPDSAQAFAAGSNGHPLPAIPRRRAHRARGAVARTFTNDQ
jgi:hypothetical protein